MRTQETSILVRRLAIFYAALFALFGIQMPFLPVWLEAKDVDPGMIGIILAAPIVARLLAVPVFMREADRRDAVRAALIVCGFAGAAGYVLVGLSAGWPPVLLGLSATSRSIPPHMPLRSSLSI